MRKTAALACLVAGLLAAMADAGTCPDWILRGDGFRPCDAAILATGHAAVAHVLPRTNPVGYALAALAAHGPRPPLLLAAITDSSMVDSLRAEIARRVAATDDSAALERLPDWVDAVRWVELSRADYGWPQDTFFTWADSAGSIHITERPPAAIDQTAHAGFARRVAAALSDCGSFDYVGSEQLLREHPEVAAHAHEAWEIYAGGNLEGIGAGLCLTSKSLHRGFVSKALSTEPVQVDISFLHVGHVDELFAVLEPPPRQGCRRHVLWASPGLAVEILAERAKADPDTPLVDDAVFGDGDGSRVLDQFFTHLDGNTARHPLRNRVGDLVRIYREEELFRSNVEMVEAIQQKNLERLLAAMRMRDPACAVDGHPVPVLFANLNYWLSPEQSRSNFALFANQVNSVFFTAGGELHGILVDGQIAGFNSYTRTLLESLDVKLGPELFDASALNRDLGNLHCATQVIRACAPADLGNTGG